MSLILRGLLVIATAGALSLPSNVSFTANGTAGKSSRRRPVVSPNIPRTPTVGDFEANQLEYYLGDDGIAYIRPGLKVKVNSITNVGPGQKPVVDFNLTDNFNQPLDRLGEITPGPISTLGFILSSWNPTTRYYHTYTLRTRSGVTNPSSDRNGTFTDLEMGHYIYTFGTTLPNDLDVTDTFTLGVYSRRTLRDIIGKDYYADNVFVDFRPDGGTAGAVWDAMDVDATCNRCHDPLGLHGGTRRTVKMCVMCHNNQVQTDSDTGESFDARVFFHKLHRGENLPSVEDGGEYIAGGDWSHVVFPQDIRNCTTCHDPDASENDIWYTRPSRIVCGSCHDDVDWITGENHAGLDQADDSACADCHVPDSGLEFDASIKGAHTIELKSKQLKGVNVEIVNVADMVPGESPTVTYKITQNDDTVIDGTQLSTFSPMIAGPTTSYRYYYRENGKSTGVFDATAGTTTYTFTAMIPEDASGTWLVTGDFYMTSTLVRGDGDPDITGIRDAAINPIEYVAITGAVTPRRTIVTMAKCNECHQDLALHGSQRKMIEECVACHNPTMGDEAVRVAGTGEPESISFQRMIHRIHTGEELTQDLTIYGYRSSVHNYNEVLFPGDRRNCSKCHTGSSYMLPVALGADPVITLRDYFSPQGPGTASCLGCHDNVDAAAHAWLNTTTFPGWDTPSESCATCHGTNKVFSVDKVHAR